MLSLIQNLRIGTKLAIASAFGILLVLALNASQLIGNGNVRRSSEAAVGQQQLAREAVEAKLAVRSMQTRRPRHPARQQFRRTAKGR